MTRTVMPLQQGSLPEGLRWHRRLRVGGWMNALFAWEGADAQNEGRPVAPGALLTVDAARRTVRLVLPSAALGTAGRADALKGARVWVTTWDYDGGYRASSPEPQANVLGAPEGSPRVMDASAVITLP